ncbi:hypothetical protein F0562_000378 [Nyssa sinensis]|uniref:P-type Ca(2+) transporter n=1 Tax=Nyssa sinensis TaxID=561372 RepID=A0A5J5C1F7_9ASTE|nr:hypothetical protein F0562_000378 [Nyssa sinensis]
MAASSLRCIAFAQKEVPEEEHEDGVEHHKLKDNGLTLLGLVGLKDLCQPGAKKAVEDCQHARVNVKMITGDNVFTARSIATECGILGPNQDVNGAVCLKQKGHVVAVTGDGTNDAPVLKEADIGLSMGIQGTEVAKESSDIVILDDNLASVATALRWGRFVYNNIQKFIQFQLTVNVAALVINFVAAVSAGEVPLTAVQLLWVNLIMDTLGALALATEQPTKELMERPPVGRIEPLITNIMWRNLLAQALYQIAVLLTLQFKGESIFGINQKVAMVEFLKKFADTERLNWGQWGACIGIAVISWPIDWLVKCIPVTEKPFFNFFSINQSSLTKSSLTKLVNERNREQLRQHGGTEAIVLALKSDAENGINGDIDDIACRQKAFGANIYQKPPKVVHFMLDVFKDPIILILFVCAALSLGFGIKKHGLKEGWHEGGSIFVSLLLVIVVSAVNRSWPNRQFNKLSEASNRIQIDVIRNGQQQHISVSDIVVGDVVCLQIGDQVPANGLYLNGHSLKVNESDMTGQNDLVEVNLIQNPFLLVGTKVANGYARMLVTSVGMNTAWSKMRAIVGILATPVVIAAAAIPEGLLLVFRITVAYSTKKMADDQALVKKLSACERIGSMTVICTDLTGGLNHGKVTEFWLRQKYIKECAASQIASEVLELLHQGFGLNTNQAPSGSVFELSDKAVYKKKTDNTIHEHLKGAPEVILPMCSHYRDEDDNGTIKVIDNGARMKLDKVIEGMAVKGLQCIAFAHKQMPKDDNDELRSHPKLKEDGLTLIGFVGLEVPCQLGVREAIKDCQDAGVKIKMITRDDISTARSIANECGIIETNQDITTDVVVEGVEFRTCTHEERMEKVDKVCVMARASPSDKLLMVQCLKQKGHVVAVIEDGTGDEEVLGAADISLSLRIQGTDMANERSDVVILGSNFDSVVTALRWGRGIYNNIQIFTQLQLTVCIASLVMDFVTPVSAAELPTINIITAISTGEVPYATLQLLWVKLIVGTLTALAFTIEQPTRELHQMPCVDPNAPFITNIMWTSIMAQGLYQIAIMLTIHFKGESIFHVNAKVRDTMVFNISVLCQVFMMFSMRKFEKNVFKEIERRKLYWAIIGIIIILQLVMVEFLKGAADTERLDWGQWGACTGIAAVSWPLGLLVKFIPLPEKPFLSYLKQQKLSRASSPSGSRAVSPPSRSGV